MAKKKRKKRPGGPPKGKPARRPDAAGASEAAAAGAAASEKQARREAAIKRRQAEKRRQAARRIVLASAVVLVVVAVFVGRWFLNNRSAAEYQRLAATAGCGEVTDVGGLSRDHWEQGDDIPTYRTSPPAGGSHTETRLPQGVYREPLSDQITAPQSIYMAVHSLEHGYVVIWHDGVDDDELGAVERALRGESEVILVPYEGIEGGTVALTAWGKLQVCERADPDVITAFIERFRNSTAPEAAAT